MRTNVYKNEILKLLRENHLLSISDIHSKVPNADYSTVYRNVEQLFSDKQIRKVVLDKGATMYELNDEKDKHDHFLCLDCGDVESIHSGSLNQLLPHKYAIQDVLIRGLCEECNTK